MTTEDRSALFLAVMERHKGILYKIAHSYCKVPDDRKDLIQEIFIQLWRSYDKYDDTYQHSTWIYRIALNTAISFYRKTRVRDKLSLPITEGEMNFRALDDIGETEANLSILQQFIQELKEMDKALMLLYLEEKSYREISAITGITETNVATKISRIKTALQQKFLQLKEK